MWLFAIAIACYLQSLAIAQQCPTVSNVNPKSGLVFQLFTVTGINLNGVSSVGASTGSINYTIVSSSQLNFQFTGGVGNTIVTVRLTPSDVANCNVTSFTLDIKSTAPIAASISSAEGQPGTVVRVGGCFPSVCGDNSSTYSIQVGGIEVELISSTITGANNDNAFYVRLVPINSPISNAAFTLVSQYGTVYPLTLTQINYMLPGSITSITPSSGQEGTEVTIIGTNLIGLGGLGIELDTVSFGNVPATIISSSQTQVIARVSSGPSGSTFVSLNSTQYSNENSAPLEGPYTISTGLWTQLEDGAITKLVPPAGQQNSTLYICGERLRGGGSIITNVSIANTQLTMFSNTVLNLTNSGLPSECITAVVPSSNVNEGTVNITSNTKAIVYTVPDLLFQYANISSVSPNEGQEYTYVTITGTHLLSGYDNLTVIPNVFLNGIQAIVQSYTTTEILVQASPGQNKLNQLGDLEIQVTQYNITSTLLQRNTWTYLQSGEIQNISPSTGVYGIYINVTGNNLLGYGGSLVRAYFLGSSTGNVSIDPTVEAEIISYSESVVILSVPLPRSVSYIGAVDVTLVADNGAQITGSGLFQYIQRGTINSITPTEGQGGTYVTLSGDELFGYGSNVSIVRFGGVEADIIYSLSTNSSITVRVGEYNTLADTSVNITIVADNHAIITSTQLTWTYLRTGEILSVSPSRGQFGSLVTITGINLLGGGTNITQLYIDGVAPILIVDYNSTRIMFQLGDESTRDVNFPANEVYIESNTGAIIKGGYFLQLAPGMILSFSPVTGRQGTVMTINGYNLTGYGMEIVNVVIGGYSSISTSFQTTNEDSRLVIQVGPAPNGTSDKVRIIIDTGAIIESNLVFKYVQPGSIDSVLPTIGAEGVGILIEGISLKIGLLDITSVTIGGSQVMRIVTTSFDHVSVIAGPAPTNLVNQTIMIVSSDGSFVEGGYFTYQNLSISINGLKEGQYGTQITLMVPFPVTDLAAVYIGDQKASIISIHSVSMTVNVTIPRATMIGQHSVDVAVERENNVVIRLQDGFTYLPEGIIDSVEPNLGQKGTSVSIKGERLLGGGTDILSVTIGNIPAEIIGYSNDVINVTIGNNPSSITNYPHMSDIRIISNTGAIVTRLQSFSYIEPGQITSFTPSTGQYGTVVTIKGNNLLQGGTVDIASVLLAGIEAILIGTPNDTYIQVQAMSSPPLTGSVTITLSTGAVISSTGIEFQYQATGNISTVTPAVGTVGTMVTITGTNLLGGGTQAQTMMLNGVLADVIANGNSHMTVRANVDYNITGDPGAVIIISETGSIVMRENAWTYEKLGDITSFTPQSGQQGINVLIGGVSLIGTSGSHIVEVTLAGIPATITFQNNTMLTATAGYSNISLTGPIILKAYSGPIITSNSNWSYYEASIVSASPTTGVYGTYVTLDGVNIIEEPGSNSTISNVTFGTIEAYNIVVLSQNSIQVRAGNSDVPTGPLTVQVTLTSGIFLTLQNQWSYLPPGRIASVEPVTGAPGENITIYGSSLVPTGATSASVTTGDSRAFEAVIVNTSVVQFRTGVYQSVDAPNVPLAISIESNDGSIVYNGTQALFSFNTTGDVTVVYPIAGGTGSTVEINGTNLLSGSTNISNVFIAGIAVADIISYSDTRIVVTVGPGSNVTGTVIIESGSGLFTGLANQTSWSYLPALNSTHVSPLYGSNGTVVTIATSLIPSQYVIQSVSLAGIEALVVSASNDQLVVMAMQSSLATPISDITLVYQDDIKLIISDSWRYLTPPSITNTSTSFGYYKSIVVINGLGFQGGGTDVAAVFLAGFDTRIIAQSDTQLTVVINEPFDSSGSGNITGPIVVAGDDGSTHTFSDSMFTYLQVSVESVTPNFGQYGTIVTIKGIGLLAGGTVVSSMSLANVSVENVLSASNSEIKVVASLSSAETGPSDIVYITNTGALVTITTSWSYVSPGSITSITPPSGQQGRIVTITGKGMLRGGSEAVEVLLSGVASMEILVSHDDFIQVRAGLNGPAPAGEVTIISNTGAQITSNVSLVAYEYLAAGNITSLIPSDGQYGTRVSIGGTGLYSSSGINYVTVSNVQADILSYNSTAINIMLNQPTIITSMEGPVRVVSVDGSIVESSTSFTYLQVGQIHLVHPQEGQRGANVTIAGDRLRGGGSYIDTVLVSGIPADIAMESDTELMVTINENVDSYNSDVTGDIVIISDTGSAVKRIDGWTYTQVGSVQTISPASGQYGTFVTITGERLVSGGVSVNEVYIGNVPSLEIVSSNETVVIFRAGETNSSFNGSISLISNYNSNLTSLNMTWMYLEKSQVLLVEPSNSTGGMIANITGRNLLGGGTGIVSISLAGIEVRNIIAFDDTYIEIETGFNPDGQPKAGDIRIESNTGALTIVPDGWVYESECPLGQYGNNTNSCSPCHTECDHCHGPTQFNCYSCKNFKIIHDMNAFECVSTCPSLSTLDKECVDNCTSSQYQQISTLDGQVYCLNCHPLCDPKLSCRGPLPSECTACTEYAERGECVTGCSIGSYVSNGTCLPCHEQCLPSDNCTGPASYDCNQCTNVSIAQQIGNSLPLVDVCITECPTSYYIDHNSVCQLCHSECRGGCTGPLRTNCNECLNAYIRHSNTIECVAACNAVSGINTMYQDPLTGECKSCHRLCSISSGCTGPSATDCILCSNFTGSNVATDFIPLFDGECVHTCPNESYYIELRNGNCELCDPICTIGCTGPASSDCIPEPTSTPTDNTVGPFQAGPGAIAIVVVIAVVLVIALIILIVVLIVKLRKRDRYRVDNAGNVEHSLEPVQQAYRRNPISETNIDIIEEPRRKPLQQQIQYKGLSFEHVEVSENNPAYTEVPRTIELLEEDEKSLGRSIENLHDTDRPSSPLSDVDETTNLLNKPHPKPPEQSDRPPPIPKKASKSNIPVSHQEVDPLQFLPEPNLDGEFEPTELYTEMDDGNNLTQDVYTEMDPPTSTMISEDADDFYEETDAAANTGYGVDYRTAQEVMASHPPLSSDKPPVIPRRDIEVKPALPPRMKKGSTSNVKK